MRMLNQCAWNIIRIFQLLFAFFFNWDSQQSLRGTELQKKRSTKILKHTANPFIKNLQLKGASVNSRFKAI